jgi:hypothetical protein
MDTKGTNSNVAWQLQNSDTGGHETNRSGQREDVAGRFSVVEKGCRKEVAGCSDDKFWNCAGTGEDFRARRLAKRQKVKGDSPKSRVSREQSRDTSADRGLDLTVLLGTVESYVDLKGIGKLGRIQKLWEQYCRLRFRMGKLKAEIGDVEQELLLEEPSIFDTSHSLVGARSFAFRARSGNTRTNPELAMRNAVILQQPSLTAKEICKRLDSHCVSVPDNLLADFPSIKTWEDAYENLGCRPRIDRLISGIRAHGSLP